MEFHSWTFYSIFAITIVLVFPSHIQSQKHWRHTDDSSKYSNYNESCSQYNASDDNATSDQQLAPLCNSVKFLACSNETNLCTCQQDPDSETVFNYDPSKESCVPAPKTETKVISDDCTSSRECWESHFGEYSKCDLFTETCECYDTITNGQQPVVQIDGTCYLKRAMNDSCETNAECNATIVGDAVCVKQTIHSSSPPSNLGVCACAPYAFWDNRLQECLHYADTGTSFTCKSDKQCSHPTALGNLSRCDEYTRKCECFDVDTNGRRPAGEFNGKCYVKLRVNETCENDIQCKIGSGENSACIEQYYAGETKKFCSCHDSHVWGETEVEDEEQCLIIGVLNSKCTSDNQCVHSNGLGELSKCAKLETTPKIGQCICWDPVGQSFDNTGFTDGACYYKLGENERCNSTNECIVGWSSSAICEHHESYNGEKVCQCPEGIVCKANGAGSLSRNIMNKFEMTLYLFIMIFIVKIMN